VYDAAGAPRLTGLKWKFHTGDAILSSPAIANGLAYIGSTDGYLYAVALSSGTMKWKETKARIVSSPAVAGELIYFSSYDGWFYAVDGVTEKLTWRFKGAGGRRVTPRHIHGALPAAEAMPNPFDYARHQAAR
jgi:eukaryotic-like serine/threonine-protein kinase